MQLACPNCACALEARTLGEPLSCPTCKGRVGILAQLDQALARWYEPRRWRADLVQPNVFYLIELLWTGNGQGERLFNAVSPKHVNYDVFRYMVTRLIARGVEDGWARLRFPDDPLVEDPSYNLEFRDSERFASAVEALFPDVNWDEQIQAPAGR